MKKKYVIQVVPYNDMEGVSNYFDMSISAYAGHLRWEFDTLEEAEANLQKFIELGIVDYEYRIDVRYSKE